MVQSSIVVPTTSQKRTNDEEASNTQSPEEIKRPRIQESEAGQKRNKRLFGALLGTLNKFKDETEKNSEIDKKRQAINEKLHEKLERERAQLQESLRERREEKMRQAEEKLEKEKQLWQEKKERSRLQQEELLANFLKTTTQPALYYLPQKLTDSMQSKINQQKEQASGAKRNFDGENCNDDPLTDNEEERKENEKAKETERDVNDRRFSEYESDGEEKEIRASKDTSDKVDQEATAKE
ncbi:Peptidyl-prolyl cis-trans isomerase pin4 [Mucor velutinosus]|uniref:Peptidyl-prolyl cis-trans isomerase pin4 n=1 Tax=Mucor velutinosus TaxID=708070 RepID=A0AAN7I236_9FUNG|nr:Peptidyl-prolyl cis-trans isomerase pin4 [Mucor velutinosus]